MQADTRLQEQPCKHLLGLLERRLTRSLLRERLRLTRSLLRDLLRTARRGDLLRSLGLSSRPLDLLRDLTGLRTGDLTGDLTGDRERERDLERDRLLA